MTAASYTGTPAAGRVSQLGQYVSKYPNFSQVAADPSVGMTAQVSTCTVAASPSSSTVYAYKLAWSNLSRTISVTTDASATQAELSALLLAALKADPFVAGIGTYTEASNVITHTFKPGIVVTLTKVTDADSKLTLATTTAAADAPSYPFGRFVVLGAPLSGLRNPTAALPTAPTLSSFVLAITHGASAAYSYVFNVMTPLGAIEQIVIAFSAGASATATGAAAVVAADAALSGISSSAAAPSGSDVDVTVTLPTGYTYAGRISKSASGGGGSPAIDGESIVQAVKPGTMALVPDPNDENQSGTTPNVAVTGGTVVPALVAGAQLVVLDPGVSVTFGDPVYVEFTAGATLGRPYNAYANGRYLHPTAKWIAGGLSNPLTGESLAIVEL